VRERVKFNVNAQHAIFGDEPFQTINCKVNSQWLRKNAHKHKKITEENWPQLQQAA